jgi:Tfp pilus assembly pilus retraction ATPase PilT
MSENLLVVLNRRLAERKVGKGRIVTYEMLANSYLAANQIREVQEHQIRSILQ